MKNNIILIKYVNSFAKMCFRRQGNIAFNMRPICYLYWFTVVVHCFRFFIFCRSFIWFRFFSSSINFCTLGLETRDYFWFVARLRYWSLKMKGCHPFYKRWKNAFISIQSVSMKSLNFQEIGRTNLGCVCAVAAFSMCAWSIKKN